MISKSTVTLAHLKIVKAEETRLLLEVHGFENPIPLELTKYDGGVVVHIPWHAKEELGDPDFQALKTLLRPVYEGRIGTRTEASPAFRRAAAARAEREPANLLTHAPTA